MQRVVVKYTIVAIIAAAGYYVLTFFILRQLFGNIPGLEWLQNLIGPLAGARIWAHLVHALALLLAGIPSALLLAVTCRPRTIVIAAFAGALTAAAGLNPNILFYRGHADGVPVMHVAIDCFKFIGILMLLTWLASKLPSNYAMQRSSRVDTPLAGTGAGENELQSASGAPTARRR